MNLLTKLFSHQHSYKEIEGERAFYDHTNEHGMPKTTYWTRLMRCKCGSEYRTPVGTSY